MTHALFELSKRKELWVPDEHTNECSSCQERFSTVKRRHHCRVCGRIFCKKCSRGVIELPAIKLRCCLSCINYLEVTPEQEILQLVHARLAEAARGGVKPPVGDSMTVSSDSDGETESDPSFTPSSSVESAHGFEVTEQADDMVTEREEFKGRASSLNAQLFVSYVEARNLELKQECIGIYSVLSLGKQQVRTVDTKSAGLSRSAQWSEGFYFDVTDSSSIFIISVWAQYQSNGMESSFLGQFNIPVSAFVKNPMVDREFSLLSKKGTPIRSTVHIKIQYTTIKVDPLSATKSQTYLCLLQLTRLSFLVTAQQKVTPDDFQLLQVVGRGNFGKVMQVRKKDTGRIYAMKVLRKDAVVQNDAVEHTISEKNVLKRISHPFIVSLKYSFQTADKLYLVLDYLCGGELFTHLSSVDHFTEDRTRFYAAQIVLALGHLHENGVIYRDLKPENLMLDMDGYLCLTDFGLCKEGLAPGQKTRTFCGSPEYLAPEILKGKPYDKAVDWWALGTFIYEMLSGWPPYFDEDPKRMNKMILLEPLTFEPSLFPSHAQSLIAGLLNRDPEKRLGSGLYGTQNIKNHPFFAKVNWDKLYKRQIEPPYKPHLRNITDTRFFSEEFTGEPVKDSYVDSHISKTYQDAFVGFSWQNASEYLDNYPKNLPEYAIKRRTRRPSRAQPFEKDSLGQSGGMERGTPSPRQFSPLSSVNENEVDLDWDSPPEMGGSFPSNNSPSFT
jgi:serine/threonine protein kinase